MDDNKNLPVEKPTTDIVGRDAENLQKFRDAGMPNIGQVNPDDIPKMFELYLNGKTYTQISNILRVPKVAILYLSDRGNWFQNRASYFEDIEKNMAERIVQSRLQRQDFLLNITHALHRKVGEKIQQYLISGDEKLVNQIDWKVIDRYLKIQEMVEKSIDKPQTNKAPLVGINVGEGATLTRTGENTIEVTPKQKAIKNMLKELANARRAEEKGEGGKGEDDADD